MSKIEVNTVEPQCGTTLTLGANNDTVALGTGAAFSGGIDAVKWETTPQTGSFGALAGRGYFMNTTSGALTLTLPASPNSGDVVAVKDYAGTFDTNNVTVARNSSPIDAGTSDAVLDTKNLSVLFIYVDGTQGWKAVQSDNGFYGPEYVTATGGTITTSGNFKIHTFTGPGTFEVTSAGNLAGSNSVDYLVAAGGGSGAGGDNGVRGGGGGAGGYRESSGAASGCYTRSPLGACVSALPVTAQAYPITVGGGASTPGPNTPINSPAGAGNQGSNSIFSTITSTGGGGGANFCGSNTRTGGSGGGGGVSSNSSDRAAGAGNTPPVSPPQGNNSGTGTPYAGAPLASGGGGGGGATAVGGNGSGEDGGAGGAGATSSINGTPTARAGGGGGGGSTSHEGAGGAGGGGTGGGSSSPTGNSAGVAGTANTGGGGGGGSSRMNPAPSNPNVPGSAGGSGIVIIRYKFQ